jgi:hypothetical protein
MLPRTIYKSHNTIRLFSIVVWFIASLGIPSTQVYAARGMPDSTEFGYGARLDLWGQEVDLSINSAVAVGLDWIGIDFDWERHWPDPKGPVYFERLDGVMDNISNHRINVLLSLINPPGWAITPMGPDMNYTLELIKLLVDRYPDTLLTIELFPGANTFQGWGAPPNPAAYTELLNAAQKVSGASHGSVLIVAAGLTPLPPVHSSEDMDDLLFLNELYRAGASAFMPIVSVRLKEVSPDIMAPPDGNDARVFRHYESVRQVMLKHQHTNGLIWITDFVWPSTNLEISQQVRWLIQALNLTKSQLYLGVAFFDRLNPPTGSTGEFSHSLIQRETKTTHLHPALGTLGQIITVGRTGQKSSLHNYLYKRMIAGPEKNNLKTNKP